MARKLSAVMIGMRSEQHKAEKKVKVIVKKNDKGRKV